MKLAFSVLAMMPEQASSVSDDVDTLFYGLLGFCVFITFVTFAIVVTFCIRYRSSKERHSKKELVDHQSRQHKVEYVAIAMTTLVFLVFFVWSAKLYFRMFQGDGEALPIYVVGKQWMWKLQHGNGKSEINELHVPVGVPVELIMSSQDVIHSFYVPAFRLKYDVVPGRYTRIQFTATKEGRFDLFCAELCGVDHSSMVGEVAVLSEMEYQEWLGRGAPPDGLAYEGKALYTALGCSGCHEPGSTVPAPQLEGLLDRPVALAGGGTVQADRQYLRDSILLPNKQVVAGFAPVMPTYEGQLKNEEINALVEYLVSKGGGDE